MNVLEFLLSKKILVVLSGLIFTSVAVASSGAESLFQENGLIVSETKIPEVQNIIDDKQTSQKSSYVTPPAPTTKPIPSSTPIVSATPKPSSTGLSQPKPTPSPKLNTAATSSQTTITGLRQTGSDDREDEEDESDESEINEAFQKANEQSEEED